MSETLYYPVTAMRKDGRVDILHGSVDHELGDYDAGLIQDLSPEAEEVLDHMTSPNNPYLHYHRYGDIDGGHYLISYFTGLIQERQNNGR